MTPLFGVFFGRYALDAYTILFLFAVLMFTAALVSSLAQQIKRSAMPDKANELRLLWLFSALLALTYGELLLNGFHRGFTGITPILYLWFFMYSLPLSASNEAVRTLGSPDAPLMRYNLIAAAVGFVVFGADLVWASKPYASLFYAMACIFATIIAYAQFRYRLRVLKKMNETLKDN